ncbi:hypothetical protein Anas_04983 [Armadillidium nasatum]|uniref:BAAT/Acyl-CoA thioester hydrolase C-terminal domain-containing protein n=1 Tax=Armadillidium nasatum TaxID=96803 RepID=A0A5N5SKT1_9CRUS|nr:hypothetical protein Anas_04983 [Armadillidium nasatum]
MKVKFTVLKGHLNEEEAYKPDESIILDSAIHERIYLAEGTKRIVVKEGKIRGNLFIPGGEGPFPAIVDLFGASGSLMDFRAAQFAARGIAALALAYYDYDDIPVDIPELDIEYFHDAVKYLLKQDKIKKPHVGVIGLSKGCDLAFSIATFIPEVKAAICINGSSLNSLKPLKLKDRTIPIVEVDMSKVKQIKPGMISCVNVRIDPAAFTECQIPIEKADAHFLMISSNDDHMAKTGDEHDRIASILKNHGKDNYEIVKYEGAGHLLESPYAPFAWASFHRVFKVTIVWGGNAYQHTQAAEDAWKRSIEFIRKHV